MTLLPIAAPAAPAAGAGAGEAMTTSGDFAALLALVAGATPSPDGAPASPEVATPAAASPEPQADPVEEPGRDQALPPDAVAPVATPMPPDAVALVATPMPLPPVPPAVRIAAPAGPPIPAPSHPTERPLVRVPVPPAAVDASPVLVEAPRPSAIEPVAPSALPVAEPRLAAAATTPPPSPIGRPPAEFEAIPAPVERARAEVVPPGRGRSSVTVSASSVAVRTSPALEETPPAPAPALVAALVSARTPDALAAEALVQPPGSPTRPERAPVRVPAAAMAAEASPALFAAPPIAEDSPVVSENSVQEHRVPVKPLPPVAAQASTPLPAAVTRTEATLPVDAPAPTTVAPPAVPEQIVSAVVPLHGRGDGRHEVTLELRPDDLGTIRVEVVVEQQTVHLTLHAAEPATARLLSAALAELRTALADAGLRAGDLAVGPDGGSTAGRRSRPGPPPTEKARDEPVTPARVRPVRPSAAGRLDLLL
jgi:hypothetical protein